MDGVGTKNNSKKKVLTARAKIITSIKDLISDLALLEALLLVFSCVSNVGSNIYILNLSL